MKNCEKRMALLPKKAALEGRVRVRGFLSREARERGQVVAHGDARLRDVDAGAHALQTVDDHDVAGGETALDDAQALDEPARLDGAVLHDALLVDDEHEPLA